MEKKFPDNMVPLGKDPFQFSCHPDVACFTKCCKNVDMFLFPYDIILLKNALSMDSEKFLRKYTRMVKGENPYFPSLMLKLDDSNGNCPFLAENGCTVYRSRPSSCRTYPLERAVDRYPGRHHDSEFYFLTNHEYCLGHGEQQFFSVREWVRNQQIETCNVMNDLWAEIDTIFATNPWKGEGSGGEKQRLAFMVCYDIDGFRRLVDENNIIQQFRISKNERRRIAAEDAELLKFGFAWLKLIFTGKSSLIRR